tara:strand:- start:2780 stop:5410 length:2631 start_codon:yes stop_codon:yes gene_type:complete
MGTSVTLVSIESCVDTIALDYKINFGTIKEQLGRVITTPDDVYNLADLCLSNRLKHNDYELLSSRLLSYAMELENENIKFCDFIEDLYRRGIASEELKLFSHKHKEAIELTLVHSRDMKIDSFGLHTLKRSYLYKGERPQYLWMRVAVGIHGDDIASAKEMYNDLSTLRYTHATPTLFNAGTKNPQMSSCFLIGMQDSINGIFKTISDIANISKFAGGIGVHLHEIRSKGSTIKGTYGKSDGIVPLCRVLNEVGRYVNQGGRRKGSIAIYIEPWHGDIEEFCELRKPMGDEQSRCRDLFLGLWVNNYFMYCVENDLDWYLFNPESAPQLIDMYGKEFENEYKKLVESQVYVKKVSSREIWRKILVSQIESGMPYMAYKDNVNEKTNQSNLGTIRSSNLCCEIMQYSDHKQYAVCNLASISLPSFVVKTKKTFDGEYKICFRDDNTEHAKHIKILRHYLGHTLKVDCKFEIYNETDHSHDCVTLTDKTYNSIAVGIDAILEFFGDHAEYNFEHLAQVTKSIVRNLNKIIDINFYPVIETKISNMLLRPVGIGVQGLADTYIKMGFAFDETKAMALNKCIFEQIYFSALEESCAIAEERSSYIGILKTKGILAESLPEFYDKGFHSNNSVFNEIYHKLNLNKKEYDRDVYTGTYAEYMGSPIFHGKLQYDMWGYESSNLKLPWSSLKEKISQYGTRNSLLTSVMPTASTSQILGNHECIEPLTSNLYTRTTLSGEHVILNKHLYQKLTDLGIWDDNIVQELIQNDGSVQHMDIIPQSIKAIFKTAFELPQRQLIQQSIDRGIFIDQSQSLNLFMEEPDFNRLSSCHFFGWRHGLKTGMYYLRSKPAAHAIKYGNQSNNKPQPQGVCNVQDDTCTICSS